MGSFINSNTFAIIEFDIHEISLYSDNLGTYYKSITLVEGKNSCTSLEWSLVCFLALGLIFVDSYANELMSKNCLNTVKTRGLYIFYPIWA